MEINRMLLKRKTDQLRDELTELKQEIENANLKETQDLRIFLGLKRDEAEMLVMGLDCTPYEVGGREHARFEEDLRQLRHDYHSAARRWHQLLSKHHRHHQTTAA